MKISNAEFTRLMDGIACAVTRVTYAYTQEEPSVDYVELVTRKIAVDYLDSIGIDEVEEEDEEDMIDFNDDVDETNYDPYMGCDFIEDCDWGEGW